MSHAVQMKCTEESLLADVSLHCMHNTAKPYSRDAARSAQSRESMAANRAKPYSRDVARSAQSREGMAGSGEKQMTTLETATENYIAAILESDVYRTYRAELDKVKQYPELKAQIDDFRRRNYEFQSSPDSDFDKLDRFEKEYENFRENPLVADFLAAELDFCRMMQRLNTYITAELHFE